MKRIKGFFLLVSAFIISGCQSGLPGEAMVLLDEKVVEVTISKSMGTGDINMEALKTFKDESSLKAFETSIQTAVKKQVEVSEIPDYDLAVSYGDEFPAHAIHLWLGEEGKPSTLAYMVGEGETYTTTVKATGELRALLVE
ncbi:hypothetical protein [Bacillus weihaiensis]|uniref:hypothetical protein n=1 Tax=Bacillus weihaiensis TaxID=1547283 RepID=UPI002357B3FA|nr:hypothetical protein [Bacillus weihaiensis]